jgi:hypothetical protein
VPVAGAAPAAPPYQATVSGNVVLVTTHVTWYSPDVTASATSLAAAFATALAARDANTALALVADDGVIKERDAVLAAGHTRLRTWIADCLLHDFRLVPGSFLAMGDTASWRFEDSTDCYWRTRPNALRPAWNVFPADGIATILVRESMIVALTYTYSPDWEARMLAAVAAPIRTAQAQATQRSALAAPLPTPTPEAPRVVGPAAPNTQARTTRSRAAWALAALCSLLSIGLAGISSHPRGRR